MSKKIGRNDKCPCGSQLKYKKCCLESKFYEPQIEITSDNESLYDIFNNAVGYMDSTMDEPIFFYD